MAMFGDFLQPEIGLFYSRVIRQPAVVPKTLAPAARPIARTRQLGTDTRWSTTPLATYSTSLEAFDLMEL